MAEHRQSSTRTLRAAVIGVALLLPLAALAQAPVLRLGGSAAGTVSGTVVDGAPAYPARALGTLGFHVVSEPGAVRAVIGRDTLAFWATSPFFRAGSRLHHLAFPVGLVGTTPQLPEQFFIQWLPAAYPDRFEFRGNTLLARGGAVAQRAGTDARTTAASPAKRSDAAVRVVIIDAGHGGRDPGKVGPNGLKEKDVTLLIARRLAALLRERKYEVHLTRTTDTLIALADRPRLANQWKSDRPVAVFLSIHANAASASSARGFETFFLSEARTEDERRVAEMENEAIRFEDNPAAPGSNGLDQILNGLRSDFLMRASHDLAAVLQEKLATFHPGPNRGVKRAGFYVLVGAIMPAVLIETAFISNRSEATLLGTRSFQDRIASGIADSVDEFFRRNEHLWSQGS